MVSNSSYYPEENYPIETNGNELHADGSGKKKTIKYFLSPWFPNIYSIINVDGLDVSYL